MTVIIEEEPDSRLRRAEIGDLSFLERLESESFSRSRRSSVRSLRRSLCSTSQDVLIIEAAGTAGSEPAGSVVVLRYRRSARIYSLAVCPQWRGRGLGARMIQGVCAYLAENGFRHLTLEADAEDRRLIDWYAGLGFAPVGTLPDYYGPGEGAVRMRMRLQSVSAAGGGNVVVVDCVRTFPLRVNGAELVSARQYLNEDRFHGEHYRVFNLCSALGPSRLGYYVSLLAGARDHRVIPNVTTLRDFSSVALARGVADDIQEAVQSGLADQSGDSFSLDVLFGRSPVVGMRDLAKALYRIFEAPLFKATFSRNGKWELRRLEILTLGSVLKRYSAEMLQTMADDYFSKKRFPRARLKSYVYDLAILVNPEEKNPPSDAVALRKFREAAESVGFCTEFIGREDFSRLNEFDALFIRETTAVDHPTYSFSRKAYADGLVVIDDPWSILRCSNKMYLYERLKRARVRQPRSWMLCKGTDIREAAERLPFPLVLKMPGGCFSLEVFKVSSAQELRFRLETLFKKTEVVIAQEFLHTDFDWRVGVLDGAPLFACKYYMARGHWQIYNWGADDDDSRYGNSESLPVNQVPPAVLAAALKASSLIGDGLYGVDVKESGGKAYVLEVNDNPSIDGGIEDDWLKDELYLKIVRSLFNRIERERNSTRFVSFPGKE